MLQPHPSYAVVSMTAMLQVLDVEPLAMAQGEVSMLASESMYMNTVAVFRLLYMNWLMPLDQDLAIC